MRLSSIAVALAASLFSVSVASSAPFASSADSVTKVKYTFKNNCDGLTLTQNPNGTATGRHTGTCAGNTYAGGVRAVIGGKTNWIIMTNTADDATDFEMFVLDESALTFTLYEMVNGESKFSKIVTGKLTIGAPPATHL